MAKTAPDVGAMTTEQLEALAIELKKEQNAFLDQIRARKTVVNDEIMRRARRSYAEQKLRGIGLEPTEELIASVIAQSMTVADSGVVVTPGTYRGTLEGE